MSTHTTTPTLTARQLEVLSAIADGLTNEEVGARFGITARTAKAHADVLRSKLGVSRRRLLGAKARELGLL